MPLRVLTWNLFHGRAVPAAGHDLRREFAATLAGWEWDVALLQEVPPWWPSFLARECGAIERHVLTSRNGWLSLRRAAATRWPDLVKSQGGGCNAILIRDRVVTTHHTLRLCRWPERRWLHAVRLLHLDTALWVGNLHSSGLDPAAIRDAERAGAGLLGWAATEPALLGGDFNLRLPSVHGFELAGGQRVDHLLVAGLRVTESVRVPDRGSLSDHDPVLVGVG